MVRTLGLVRVVSEEPWVLCPCRWWFVKGSRCWKEKWERRGEGRAIKRKSWITLWYWETVFLKGRECEKEGQMYSGVVKTMTCLAFMLAFQLKSCSWVASLLPAESSENIVEWRPLLSLHSAAPCNVAKTWNRGRGLIDESHPPSQLSPADGPREER